MLLVLLCALLSCDNTPEPTAPRPVAAPAPVPPATALTVGPFVSLVGLCEPSGVALDGDTLWMVDDDVKKGVFSVGLGGGAVRSRERVWEGDALKLNDAEAVAVDGASRWWTTSHSLNKDGERKKSRHRLVKTDASGVVVEAVHSLGALRETLATPPCAGCAVPAGFASKGAKEGGLDIEGLAASPDHNLMVGLRGPLTAAGHALVLSMPVSSLDAGVIAEAWALDLGGRGVRSLERLPGEDTYLLIAGPMGVGARFSLYRWSPGSDAVALGPLPLPGVGAAPEGLAIQSLTAEAVSVLVVYDEGSRVEAAAANPEQEKCDDLLEGSAAERALVTAHLLPLTWNR